MKKLVKISILVAVAVILLGIAGWYADIELLSDALLPGLLANVALASKGRFAPDGIWGYVVGFGATFITWFALIFFATVTCRFGWNYAQKRLDGKKA